MNSINITPPALARMFSGALLSDMLEQRYLDGIAAVHRLEPAAFDPIDGEPADPAGRILAAIDMDLPAVDWDTPTTVHGITPEQHPITVVSYPVTGPAEALTWIPTARLIGTPPARFGTRDSRVIIVCESATAEQIETAIKRVRRHITANLAHAITERDRWREHTAIRIRDAITARRALINRVGR